VQTGTVQRYCEARADQAATDDENIHVFHAAMIAREC
jgi:hypothetical protein